MSALDPSGASQPTQSTVYSTPGNAASKDPSEKKASAMRSLDDSEPVDQRIPQKQTSDQKEGTASSLGRGIHGAPTGEESKGLTEEDVGRHTELDGQQMAASGEGDVADAVAGRGNAMSSGQAPDMASDLDRKKAEQQGARDAMKAERKSNAGIGGDLGQSGGPASTVD
ncbi:hypothetical protein BDV96DRAFT_611254 [Lophiotrema nucula]|uniref:Uncharacterized protein n=1 Tax=Lophiotrema nucula TaxID=690887 RepID=A0A6A5ZI94_9PLEO|nr:hypothetical protein BDV96DRAFT_611254 [Lophiotrema nucula]